MKKEQKTIVFVSTFTTEIVTYLVTEKKTTSIALKVSDGKVVDKMKLSDFINAEKVQSMIFIGREGQFKEISNHVENKHKGVRIIWQ